MRKKIPGVAAVARAIVPVVVGASSLLGQSVRAAVRDDQGQAVRGVLLLLVDSNGVAIARSISSDDGTATLHTGHTGTFAIRTLRVGYRPSLIPDVTVGNGTRTVDLRVSRIGLRLDTVRVSAGSECRSPTDSTASVFSAWEQARAALVAAEFSATEGGGLRMTTAAFNRTLDGDHRVEHENVVVQSAFVRQPWRSPPPSTLHENGFVATDPSGTTTYTAPSLEFLLSDWFIADHCFRISRSSNLNEVGLTFEPIRSRRNIPELTGTLWMDRKSAELRRVTFGYANIARELRGDASGEMAFVGLRDGRWLIADWQIRMPVPAQDDAGRRWIAEVHAAGGDLISVQRGGDTVWRAPPTAVRGKVIDSTTSAPVGGATVTIRGTSRHARTRADGTFQIDSLLPGEYFVEVRTGGLDSLGLSTAEPIIATNGGAAIEIRLQPPAQMVEGLCGSLTQTALPGIVLGTVRNHASPDSSAGTVRADWTTIALRDERGVLVEQQRHSRETRLSGNGTFRLCGLPLNTDLFLIAEIGALRSSSERVRIVSPQRVIRTDLAVNVAARTYSSVEGVVVTDSGRAQIAAAEVSVPATGRSVFTDADGRYVIDSLVRGPNRLVVRKLGYVPVELDVDLSSGVRVGNRVDLQRVASLSPVVTVEQALPVSFSEHERVGLGRFIRAKDLAALGDRKAETAIAQIGGLNILHGHTGEAWVRSTRAGGAAYHPDPTDRARGIVQSCYAAVFVDGIQMNHHTPTDPFDINTIPLSAIAGIEYYAGPAQTPAEYSSLNLGCGVLIVWIKQ